MACSFHCEQRRDDTAAGQLGSEVNDRACLPTTATRECTNTLSCALRRDNGQRYVLNCAIKVFESVDHSILSTNLCFTSSSGILINIKQRKIALEFGCVLMRARVVDAVRGQGSY
eukprot:5431010-Pleurochrysis_carterae.AAC.2